MRTLVLLLALVFASGTASAESAAWLEDYIDKNPSKPMKLRPSPEVRAEKAKPAKASKSSKSSKAKKTKLQAKKKAKKAKKRRR